MNRLRSFQPLLELQLFFWKSMAIMAEKALAHRKLFHKLNKYLPFLKWGITAYAAGWLIGEILRTFLF